MLKEIKMVRGDKKFVQTLDYEGIPFRCWRCHRVGNIASDCSLTPHGSYKGHKKYKKVHRDDDGGGSKPSSRAWQHSDCFPPLHDEGRIIFPRALDQLPPRARQKR